VINIGRIWIVALLLPALSPAAELNTLFAQGCPAPGRARAAAITDPRLRMSGPDAVGRAGDYLLMNSRAAFIISGPGQINTYYYYPGIPIDAVALDGCTQAGPEQFEELALFVGDLHGRDPRQLAVRALRGDQVEVLRDGAGGGPAIVRVHGADDIFWIVEDELIRRSWEQLHIPKPISRPLGIELTVDYILDPDSPVLRIEFNLRNLDPQPKALFTAAGAFFGDATHNHFFFQRHLPSEEILLSSGLPALVSSSGTGAWAFAMADANLSTVNFSGFDALADLHQLRRRIHLQPAGESGDHATTVSFLSVGARDPNSALAPLNQVNPQPLKGWNITLAPLAGIVTDLATGAPIPNADLELAIKNREGKWEFLDGFRSDASGRFSGLAPFPGREHRLTAHLQGRPDPAPIFFRDFPAGPVPVRFSPGGALAFDLRDETGRGLPARIGLYQRGKLVRTLFSRTGTGEAQVTPGAYAVSVTRGYEYEPYQGEITIVPGETALLRATLPHSVHPAGWLSVDMHVHAGPSGDNKISIPDRIVTVAAEGLPVVVSADHEAIIPWQPAVAETGLDQWVAVITGEEVTATLPEHIGAFPFSPRFDLGARGGPVRWYGLDPAQLYAAIRGRGAQIVQLNHPMDYIYGIEYDRATGAPRLAHPEYLGFAPDAQLWSWDFDSVELQNGPQRVFDDPLHPKAFGTFETWMSFINLGHRVTAVANTDAHDDQPPGAPRNYFPASPDDPARFNPDDLIAAVKHHRVLTSTGAFARVLVNGQAGIGDTIVVSGPAVDLYLHVESIPSIDFDRVKVFVNCDQVVNLALPPTDGVIKYDGHLQIPIARDSAIVVMGFGSKKLPRGFPPFNPLGVPRFTANPVYVDLNADGYQPPGWDGCSYTLP
jgi:hypothetical protein